MLASLFRSNQPAILFAVPLVVAALFGSDFIQTPNPAEDLMPLAALVERMIGASTWLRGSLGLLLIATIAVQLAVLSNALELMERRNHLVALLFPTAMACLAGGSIVEPALLGMPLALHAFRRTWSMDNNSPAVGVLFDAGLWLGLASLFYLPYAVLSVVVWASTSLIRPFAWREYVLPVFGLALTGYLSWSCLYLLDLTPWHPLHSISFFRADAGMVVNGSGVRIAATSLIGLVLLAGLMAFGRSYQRSVMRIRNIRAGFLSLAFALLLVILLLLRVNGSAPPVLAAVPAALLCSYGWLAPKRPWLADAAALALFALVICVRWMA